MRMRMFNERVGCDDFKYTVHVVKENLYIIENKELFKKIYKNINNILLNSRYFLGG